MNIFHLFELLQIGISGVAHGAQDLIQTSGVPGLSNGIPGISKEYLPEQAAIAAAALYKQIFKASFILLPFILLAAFGITMLFTKYTVQAALARFLLIAVLFVSVPYVFGATIAAGSVLAKKIFDDQNVKDLNKQFREAARKAQDERGIDQPLEKKKSFIDWLVSALKVSTTALISDVFMALIQILFFFSTIVIYLLWRALVIILFVLAPPIILLGLIPGFGTRIVGNWYGAVLQLSLWQPFLAICSWFVRTADDVFAVTYRPGQTNSISNHVESVAVAFVMTILIWATPFVVNAIIPLSRFGAAGVQGIIGGIFVAGRISPKIQR